MVEGGEGFNLAATMVGGKLQRFDCASELSATPVGTGAPTGAREPALPTKQVRPEREFPRPAA